jgi:hypothetical protein
MMNSAQTTSLARQFILGVVGNYMAMDHGEPLENLLEFIRLNGGAAMDAVKAEHILSESGANPSHAILAAEVAKLREQRRVLREAAEHFVNKVDTGMANSRDSYARFKKALDATKD